MNKKTQFVAVLMGSDSDMPTMRAALDILEGFGIHVEVNIGERTAAVIIRSKKDGIPTNLHGRYDLETHKYHESIGPRQIPAEMLPKSGS